MRLEGFADTRTRDETAGAEEKCRKQLIANFERGGSSLEKRGAGA
jgi:hypothetical protein